MRTAGGGGRRILAGESGESRAILRHAGRRSTRWPALLAIMLCAISPDGRSQDKALAAWNASTAGDRLTVSVTNRSEVPMTGFLVLVTEALVRRPAARAFGRHYIDSLFYYQMPGNEPLAPGESRVVDCGSMPPPSIRSKEGRLAAAVFADGATWGERQWIAHIAARREIVFESWTAILKWFGSVHADPSAPAPSSWAAALDALRQSQQANLPQPAPDDETFARDQAFLNARSWLLKTTAGGESAPFSVVQKAFLAHARPWFEALEADPVRRSAQPLPKAPE